MSLSRAERQTKPPPRVLGPPIGTAAADLSTSGHPHLSIAEPGNKARMSMKTKDEVKKSRDPHRPRYPRHSLPMGKTC
jgi:hypothetical protein